MPMLDPDKTLALAEQVYCYPDRPNAGSSGTSASETSSLACASAHSQSRKSHVINASQTVGPISSLPLQAHG